MKANAYIIKKRQMDKGELKIINKDFLDMVKYGKLIFNLNEIGDIEIMVENGLFHSDFLINNRWFVIDENPNKTYTLQENMENGDIVYLLDDCRYINSFAKNVLKLLQQMFNF